MSTSFVYVLLLFKIVIFQQLIKIWQCKQKHTLLISINPYLCAYFMHGCHNVLGVSWMVDGPSLNTREAACPGQCRPHYRNTPPLVLSLDGSMKISGALTHSHEFQLVDNPQHQETTGHWSCIDWLYTWNAVLCLCHAVPVCYNASIVAQITVDSWCEMHTAMW
jgi:hypothetical protein